MKLKNNNTSVRCILLCCVSFYLFSCRMETQKRITPKEFVNYTTKDNYGYVKDSVIILNQLKAKLLGHEGFFNNSAYFDSTIIIVDSIIFSADFKKIAAFVIVKNPSYRQLIPKEKYNWYYEGTCYLGKRVGDSLILNWIGPTFSNSVDKEDLSIILKDYYFIEFATIDTTAPNSCNYNLNDIRFWDCSIWKELDKEKMKLKLFEEEKRNHSENIYEPK